MKKTTLVVMAAGMGSRFGGLKQMEPLDSQGHTLLDFSVYDAQKAGFNQVVFIIKEEIAADFKRVVGDRIAEKIPVNYVYQTMDGMPPGRTKPWGTGHAVLCCKDVVNTPFAVINADDYYGRNAFTDLHQFLLDTGDGAYAMVGFALKNTMTEFGTVARGVCRIENSFLKEITERTKIKDFRYTEDGETWISLPRDTVVSMNLWGFTPKIFQALTQDFDTFLKNGDLCKGEFFLPGTVSRLITTGQATAKVLPCADKWYGMTYREDKQQVKEAIAGMVREGLYDGI